MAAPGLAAAHVDGHVAQRRALRHLPMHAARGVVARGAHGQVDVTDGVVEVADAAALVGVGGCDQEGARRSRAVLHRRVGQHGDLGAQSTRGSAAGRESSQ